MFLLPRGVLILGVLAGMALPALPAAADGGPGPAAYDRGYYPSIWRGVYGGVHAGFGWSGDADGAVGGAQAGYNWQSQQYVYGIEADISLADIGASGSATACQPGFGCVTARADWPRCAGRCDSGASSAPAGRRSFLKEAVSWQWCFV